MISCFQQFSWASVTSKNLPPGGVVPATGVPPHVVRVPSAQVDVTTLLYWSRKSYNLYPN